MATVDFRPGVRAGLGAMALTETRVNAMIVACSVVVLATGCARAEATSQSQRPISSAFPTSSTTGIASIMQPLGSSPAGAAVVGISPRGHGAAKLVQGCPPEMALVHNVCVDRYEGHLVTVGDDGREEVFSPYERPADARPLQARSRAGVYPQGYISGIEAEKVCRNAGKRLCTLAEWFAACRGPSQTMFPYGEIEIRGKCNTSKPHLLTKLFGPSPKSWTYAHFNDPSLNREAGYLGKTGEYSECRSGESIFDMVGNLHEWVSDRVDGTLESKVPLRDDIRKAVRRNTGHGIFMGGFYSTSNQHGRGCGFVTIGHEQAYHDYSTGFRCCRDVP